MTVFRLALLILLISSEMNCEYDETTEFINKATLKQPEYELAWNYNDDDIVFKLTVETTGWVMFGLSPSLSSEGAEVFVVMKNSNGSIEIRDAFISVGKLNFNVKKISEMLFYSQSNDATTVIVKRPIQLCTNETQDTKSNLLDVKLVNYVIFSWGVNYKDNNDPNFITDNLGTTCLPLISTVNEKMTEENDVEIVQFHDNFIMPNNQNSYHHCTIDTLPKEYFATYRHMIKYEIVIPPEIQKYVYEITLYKCSSRVVNSVNLEQMPYPFECQTQSINEICDRISLIWLKGGNLIVQLPSDFGHKFGKPSKRAENILYNLNVHYVNINNDLDVKGKVSVRLHMTKNIRKNEYRILKLGMNESPSGIILPPKYVSLKVQGMATNDIMNILASSGKTKIFASSSNTRSLGKEVGIKLVRNGEVIDNFGQNDYYNHNYKFINFHKPITVEADDEILFSCNYQTLQRRLFTTGGVSYDDEICNHYLYYIAENGELGSYARVQNEITFGSWLYLFTEMNKTGIVLWRWNRDNSTFFSSAIASVEASPTFGFNPTYTSGVLQQFYDLVSRTQSIDNGPFDNENEFKINVTEPALTTCRSRTNSAKQLFQGKEASVLVFTYIFISYRIILNY